MTYLFIGMMIGSLAVAFKSAEKEIAHLDPIGALCILL